eukprot:m.971545 g.971545  ORF g.971545 m.971545 type:complete len:135 (-) comp23927_c0_seq16:4100-4504(-)
MVHKSVPASNSTTHKELGNTRICTCQVMPNQHDARCDTFRAALFWGCILPIERHLAEYDTNIEMQENNASRMQLAPDVLSLNHDTRSTYAATLATVTGVAAEHVVLNGIVVVASCARATKTVNRRETSTPTLSP